VSECFCLKLIVLNKKEQLKKCKAVLRGWQQKQRLESDLFYEPIVELSIFRNLIETKI